MSGITPILDTLLHHVLGRRGVAPLRPPLERPVSPSRPGQASSPTHSDSRLDPGPRPTGAGNPDIGEAGLDADLAAAMRRARAQTDPAARAAVIARLSASARDIADILARYPTPGAAVEPSAPLLSAGKPRDASLLARLLRASIETSGLFYEAHLLRWYQGRFPLQRLLREPQMRGFRAVGGSASSAASMDKGEGSTRETHSAQGGDVAGSAKPGVKRGANAAATASPLTYTADGKPRPAPQAVTAAAAGLSVAFAPGAESGKHHVVSHDLEGVLRRQLDMLASPALSWQGRPWAGVFMALFLQPPPRRPDAGPDAHRESAENDDDQAWSSHLQLRLARLGEVTVGMRLSGQRVALRIEAEPAALARLRSGRDALVERLDARGFEDVVVNIGPHPRASEDGHDA